MITQQNGQMTAAGFCICNLNICCCFSLNWTCLFHQLSTHRQTQTHTHTHTHTPNQVHLHSTMTVFLLQYLITYLSIILPLLTAPQICHSNTEQNSKLHNYRTSGTEEGNMQHVRACVTRIYATYQDVCH